MLSEVLPSHGPVALLEYPLHHNAGDTLIFAGTLAYLQRLGIPVRYVTTVHGYSPGDLRRVHPEGPILLQGGGNFGDRWGMFQAFRERVIADFPDRPVVQLPQTIEMSPSTARRIAAAYRAHGRLTVLLRDSRSMRQATQLLPGVRAIFCPDLAFGYEPSPSRGPRWDVVTVQRHDGESAVEGPLFDPREPMTVRATDWTLSRWQLARWHALKSPGAIVRRIPHAGAGLHRPLVRQMYPRITRLTMTAAVNTVSDGRIVVTDRLHATILATLVGRPVVARDNATGKISTIYADYLSRFPTVSLAHDTESATAMVRERLAASGSAE